MIYSNDRHFKHVMERGCVQETQGQARSNVLLQLAIQQEQLDVVEQLLSNGLDPNIVFDRELSDETHEANLENILAELQALGNFSPLHLAVQLQSKEILELLLGYGANPDVQDLGQATPLHWAVVNGFVVGVELLLAYKANPNLQDLAACSPLHEAVRRKQKKMMQILLDNHANPNLYDCMGATPCSLSKDLGVFAIVMQYSKHCPADWLTH
jgi:ankyrin repeat protein